MTDAAASRISALITLSGREGDVVVLGKSAAERQLEFALEAHCDRIILLGDGGCEAAISLRHRAEAAGAKVLAIGGTHGLAALAREGGKTLVMQPGLVPASSEALEALTRRRGVLICAAGIGTEMGFERIDLARSWAGALVIADDRLLRLLDLPEDAEAAPALLRIALQSGATENMLAEGELADGSWSLVESQSDRAGLEDKWIARHLRRGGRATLSARMIRFALAKFGRRISARATHIAALVALSLVLAGLAALAAWYGLSAVSFIAIALAVLTLETGLALDSLRKLPFGKVLRLPWARVLFDLALAICAVFAIDGDLWTRAFPPLVLLAALYLPVREQAPHLQYLRDRALIAALLTGFAASGFAEKGVMLMALLLLLLQMPISRGKRE